MFKIVSQLEAQKCDRLRQSTMSSSKDEKDFKIMQEYYIIVTNDCSDFYRAWFLRYSQHATVFVVSNQIQLQY